MNRTKYEEQLWSEGFTRIMGLDEVGRGCLAGPVVAAGVIFEKGIRFPEIRDSKKIDKKSREQLAHEIKERALFWTIEEGSISEIDDLNILWASIATMEKCVKKEAATPDYLLVDGNRYAPSLIPYTCIIKGDDKSISIGAASILAKVYRDKLMETLSISYPEFGWENNVGYPTKQHRDAVKKYGYTNHHRQSFNLGTKKKYG